MRNLGIIGAALAALSLPFADTVQEVPHHRRRGSTHYRYKSGEYSGTHPQDISGKMCAKRRCQIASGQLKAENGLSI